ncbi:MAG: Gfo/Idh/MocA family oxidoreductase [Pirellulales bacterium]
MKRSSITGVSAIAYHRIAHSAAHSQPMRVGLIGCGGRAGGLFKSFSKISDVVWACDPDSRRADQIQSEARRGSVIQVTGDLRHVLDDQSVDAVVVATPDHWHAPASILASAAGKHVYVEKPCSHNFYEGQLLVEAANRNNVVIQHGTQSRSNPHIVRAIQLLKEGFIGEPLICKAWNIQRRKNIGYAKPTPPPSGVDYDMWVGPAEFVPHQSNRFHYNWHWWYNFGTGDLGNDGVHEMDIARWGLGVHGLPNQANAMGGKFFFEDDQQFPDSATCTFQWENKDNERETPKKKQLIFEMRIWSKSYPHNVDSGVEFYGTKGLLFVSKRGKITVWDDSNKPVPELPDTDLSRLAGSHQEDFLEAIAGSRRPAAGIETAHDSCSLIHFANASLRLGRSLDIQPYSEDVMAHDREAKVMLGRSYRTKGHWAIPKTIS